MAYTPTEQELTECLSGKGCEFGICDECSVCIGKEESEDSNEE
jgi:hypothetical protein